MTTLKRILAHIWEQPFIFTTGLAALFHSCWSIATLFTGPEPPQGTQAWFAWVLPGFLIAFSLDVGQIVTSAEIRQGSRSWQKYTTFAVFAIATYYLQWLYAAHHMPLLELAPGVTDIPLVTGLRDLALWFLPALLPLSTLLYTFSHDTQTTMQTHPEAESRPFWQRLLKPADPVNDSAPVDVDEPSTTKNGSTPNTSA